MPARTARSPGEAESGIPGPRIVFAGTPDFAVPALQTLIDAGYSPVAVYTQPDRPAGRGRKLKPGPVKQTAQAHGLPVCQPRSLRDSEAQAELAALQPTLMVVVAYGLLLPPAVLAMPRLGCVNLHASLLPRWRGAAPVQRAIIAGDHETGISLMQMDSGLDTGPVLAVSRCPIAADDTGGSLHDRLARLGAQLLETRLEALLAARLEARPQAAEGVSYAPRITREEARIDWSQPARQIERQVRAFNPWPVAFCQLGEDTLRIWQARATHPTPPGPPGSLHAGDDALTVTTGDGGLALDQVQLPGRRPISARDLLNARKLDGQQLT